MKKFIVLTLACVSLFALTGCDTTPTDPATTTGDVVIEMNNVDTFAQCLTQNDAKFY